MPYEGEFAQYQPLRRIAETERVVQLLRRARVYQPNRSTDIDPRPAPDASQELPDFVVAIDGSNAEVPVKNGYPGARVGYCTVASVLLNLREVNRLDNSRPVDPREFRKTEEAATIDAALPGTNIVTRDHTNARNAFRESLFEVLSDVIVDEEDRTSLLETYHVLLANKPQGRGQQCPYESEGCERHVSVADGLSSCGCEKRRAVLSTDALRIHEAFRDFGSNGEAYGEVMQVWERVLLVHLLRCFERKGWLSYLGRLAFFLDGPLAVFGHPAWLSAAIKVELKRINAGVRQATGTDLLILGVEKTGSFVTHFEELDVSESAGDRRFPPGSFMLLTDRYIKERIIYSDSPKRYGADTYFGRKFFYKTKSNARIVATIPFLNDEQDTLADDDTRAYLQFGTSCALLDALVSSRFANAVSPLVSAHAHAAIPLHLGAKVLEQLARALVRTESV
jgi:hypothetical protein